MIDNNLKAGVYNKDVLSHTTGLRGVCVATHQFAYFTLKVQDAVKFPLAAALGRDAVLTASAHVVNEFQLL